MTTVYLIRHAEAEGNLYRRAQGHYNSTITARGYRQIAALAKRFADVHFDAVYASDLCRTQTTALSVALTHGLPIRATAELREVGVGEWEDRTWAWLSRFDGERLRRFNSDMSNWYVDGCQRAADVRDRMVAELHRILEAHPDQTVAVFSHGSALRLLIGTLQGMTLAEIDRSGHAENTAVAKLEADGSGIRVIFRDDASHLTPELCTVRNQLWTKTKGGVEPGIYFRADVSRPGRFEALSEEETVGAVQVSIDENYADIEELWLDESVQGKGFGIRLIGQAISYARSQGADTLCATVSREDAKGTYLALKYGFEPAWGNTQVVVFKLYFGYDEDYRVERLREAMAEQA